MTPFPAKDALPAGTVIKAEDAALMIDAAEIRRRAETLRLEAEAEAKRLMEEAREMGQRLGLADAAATSVRMLAATQAHVHTLTLGLAADLADAAAETARQIIGSETDPDVVAALVQTALSRSRRHRQMRLFVWPEAVEHVRAALGPADEEAEERVTVQADPRLAPGRMVLASEQGYVELGVAEQVATARQTMAERLGQEIERRSDTAPWPEAAS